MEVAQRLVLYSLSQGEDDRRDRPRADWLEQGILASVVAVDKRVR
jgi:hypothetical protein